MTNLTDLRLDASDSIEIHMRCQHDLCSLKCGRYGDVIGIIGHMAAIEQRSHVCKLSVSVPGQEHVMGSHRISLFSSPYDALLQ